MFKLWENEKGLSTQAEAQDRTDALSNHAQWTSLKEYLAEVLEQRGIGPAAENFRRSHYSHGGITYLCMTYKFDSVPA